ncbi:hypothetical protein IWW55_003860 [Coemansia sp. RSA 2706]|nr:hypothetical protein IWW55_003860 [Coemansia sp. RSA 2706]
MSTVEIATAGPLSPTDASGPIPQKRATSEGTSDESRDDKKRRPGRKPIETEATTKRTAQNRAAQRAFRERKQQYLKGLEDKVQELAERQERTERENEQLRKCIDALRTENKTLKTGKFTYESAPVDFEKAITELFDSSHSAGLDLSSTFGLQQAAVSGADLTQPGAMDRIQPQLTTSSSRASPQSVPVLYPSSGAQSLGGLSGDLLNGIQVLASNQNISTGSFMDQLFDSSTPAGSDLMAPYTSRSPSTSATATTPGDMFVPLNNISAGANPGLLGMDAFKGYQGDANFASLVRQVTAGSTGSSQGAPTPSLSELLSFSPAQAATDGLINLMSTPVDSSALLASSTYQDPSLGAAGDRSLALPPYLMAYRNPDPLLAGEDGDQLEKLLLSSIYSAPPAQQQPAAAPAGSGQATSSSLTSAPITVEPQTMQNAGRSPSVGTGGGEQQPGGDQCTCNDTDAVPCDPCPKHGLLSDHLSEEMRDMPPHMLNSVCSTNNRMADEELNDLCTLMFKHAKCTEVQKRVEMAREKLRSESELELFNTKMKLAKQFGLQ